MLSLFLFFTQKDTFLNLLYYIFNNKLLFFTTNILEKGDKILTLSFDKTPIIELSSKFKGRLHVAELVLKSLEIPYKIVKKPSVDFWKERLVKIKERRKEI